MNTVVQYLPMLVGLFLAGTLILECYRLITRDMHPLRVLTAALSAAVTYAILGLFPLLPETLSVLLSVGIVLLAGAVVYATFRLLSSERPQRVAAVLSCGSAPDDMDGARTTGGRTAAQKALQAPGVLSVIGGALVYAAVLALALIAAL